MSDPRNAPLRDPMPRWLRACYVDRQVPAINTIALPSAASRPVTRPAASLLRHSTAFAVVLLAVHTGGAWLARKPGILLGHNDAMYVALGQSLRRLNYLELWYSSTPPHAMYPPVYPAVLAVLETIHGGGFHWLVWSNLLASTAALALLFAAVRTTWGPLPALGCLAVLAVNPTIVAAAGTLGAETQMMLAISVVVYSLAHEQRGPHMSVLAGLGALVAALLRSAAVPLVAAVALYWLLKRQYKRFAIYSLASALSVGSWLLWSAAAPNQSAGRSYVGDAMLMASHAGVVSELLSRIAAHLPRYAAIVYWELPMPTLRGFALDNAIGGPLALAALVVGFVAIARAWTAAGLFMVLYGVLLSIWPYIEDRFVAPIIPLVVTCTAIGCITMMRSRTRVAVVVGSGILVALIATGALSVASAAARGASCNRDDFFPDPACLTPAEREFLDAMRYIRDKTPADAVFLSAKPATLYYYTGRRSVIRELAAGQRPEAFLSFLKSQRAKYLLLGRADYMEVHRFAPRIRAICDALDVEQRIDAAVYLFRVREDAVAGNGDACEAMERYDREVKYRPSTSR